MYLDKVVELANCRHPIETPSHEDWCRVEGLLGFCLPADYKGLVSTLGSGRFGSLALRNPLSSSRYGDFDIKSITAYHRGLMAIMDDSLELFPSPGGFLHIGMTPFGCELFVQPILDENDSYEMCWFDLDVNRGCKITVSLCQFLYDLFLERCDESWAKEEREMIWGDFPQFFTGGADLADPDRAVSLNG